MHRCCWCTSRAWVFDKKCNLQLAQATRFQGMWLDTKSGLVMLTQARQNSLSDCLMHNCLGGHGLLEAVLTPLGPHGTESNPPGPYAFPADAAGLPCACQNLKHHGGSICQQFRRLGLFKSGKDGTQTVDVGIQVVPVTRRMHAWSLK